MIGRRTFLAGVAGLAAVASCGSGSDPRAAPGSWNVVSTTTSAPPCSVD